eukprot:622375_1
MTITADHTLFVQLPCVFRWNDTLATFSVPRCIQHASKSHLFLDRKRASGPQNHPIAKVATFGSLVVNGHFLPLFNASKAFKSRGGHSSSLPTLVMDSLLPICASLIVR